MRSYDCLSYLVANNGNILGLSDWTKMDAVGVFLLRSESLASTQIELLNFPASSAKLFEQLTCKKSNYRLWCMQGLSVETVGSIDIF